MPIWILALCAAMLACLALSSVAQAGTKEIVYVNVTSTAITKAQVAAELPAFQLALDRDFGPIWKVDAVLTMDPAGATMVMNVDDWSTAFGALGFHDVSRAGMPYGAVFIKSIQWDDDSWQIVFTHELFEMLADPYIDRFERGEATTWLVEPCDPVEADRYAYNVNGVPISDFVTPRWYHDKRLGRYDFTGAVKKAYQVLRGGYVSWWDGSGWEQTFA